MLKRILTVAALIAWPLSASADADLAAAWGHKAGALYVTTLDALEGETVPATFEGDLIRFAVTSARLGGWVDETSGPGDLGCIFRGMAEEAELQLDLLDDPVARQGALKRLATLFYDAENIAAAAVHANAHPSGYNEVQQPSICAANGHRVVQYLTEQP